MPKFLVATQCIVLSERDTTRVLKLLLHPPKPTAALLAAARRRVHGLSTPPGSPMNAKAAVD